MTEEEFLQFIEEATGKSIHRGDYGFITGTMHPLMSGVQGIRSAAKTNGFTVWKEKPDGTSVEKELSPLNQQQSIEQIIAFLKEDIT